ncbi:Uncharacterised protein [Mycobacteroides abscessus subsp. abscessus]|uniref:hypothetical protein n=1 Tax=Mycobacteroides abscessus TaxID=36809 RepID=UPI00092C2D7C|nr:hypothetical protein [Mycobacteroides abscessus]SIA00103.1 Uncharacterised protein [Mycobacteroides abscessus subsp. abscessus]SIA00131.1 Uncharacterised protein [Mycobacteroides abscessus subsp. abscessus]
MTTTPRGLKAGGRRLWAAVTAEFGPDDVSAEQLAQACYTVDLLADLRAEIAQSGLKVDSPQGVRVSPFVVEIRQQRLLLAKLIAGLGLPKGVIDDDEAAG